MPELPEVETVVRELNKKLKNHVIIKIEVRSPKLVSVGPQTVSNIRDIKPSIKNKFIKLLTGTKITSVSRRGKMLIFDVDGPLCMLAHLKMTGQFIFEDPVLAKKTGSKYRLLNRLSAPLTQLPSKHTHVIFSFKDGSTLYFNDIRQFGYLRVVEDEDLDKVVEFKIYGPEPLSKQFTFDKFFDGLKGRKSIAIKLALMDPKVVVGIGNIYSDEILYHAKINPSRRVSKLNKEELSEIYRHVKPVLEMGVKHKGSSVGDFIRTDGKWGSMGKYHFVYGRKGKECKNCGASIISIKLGGRTSSYCPNEQI